VPGSTGSRWRTRNSLTAKRWRSFRANLHLRRLVNDPYCGNEQFADTTFTLHNEQGLKYEQ
jgi:hypothetical protein